MLSVPLVFYLLPGFGLVLPSLEPFLLFLMVTLLLTTVIGILMNMMARKALGGLLQEGHAWERAGISAKAEKKFHQALRLYDSFLLGLFSTGKVTRKMLAALARHQLAVPADRDYFRRAAAVYVNHYPEDTVFAEQWINWLHSAGEPNVQEMQAITQLAETGYANPRLLEWLSPVARPYGRRDFESAKLVKDPKKESLRREIEQETIGHDMPGRLYDRMEQITPFSQPGTRSAGGLITVKKIRLKNPMQTLAVWVVEGGSRMLRSVGSVWSFIILIIQRGYGSVSGHQRVRTVLKAVSLGLASAGLIFFLILPLLRMLMAPEPIPSGIESEPITISKPFTIQVSAYLKKEYADNYAAVLKKKGIEATVKQVVGGGKTWFVVHVSEFVDKKSAEAYGQNLKNQKIIDDFFVNNQ